MPTAFTVLAKSEVIGAVGMAELCVSRLAFPFQRGSRLLPIFACGAAFGLGGRLASEASESLSGLIHFPHQVEP